jgi:hypothetical protein
MVDLSSPQATHLAIFQTFKKADFRKNGQKLQENAFSKIFSELFFQPKHV